MDHLDRAYLRALGGRHHARPPASSIPIAAQRRRSRPPGPSASLRRPPRRRAIAGMTALAVSAAALASGGTVAALGAAGVLAHQAVAAARGGSAGRVASAAVPASPRAGHRRPRVARSLERRGRAQPPPGQSGGGHDRHVEQRRRRRAPGTAVGNGGSQGQSLYGLPTGQTPVGVGSGVIFDSNGWILTNHHVVADRGTLTVQLSDGRSFPATVYGTDTLTDLAIVKIDATGLPTATLGDSSALELGQTVIAVGDPLGKYPGTVTTGVVSGVDRSHPGHDRHPRRPHPDRRGHQPRQQRRPARSTPDGAVIGIDTAIGRSAQGIGFAIPINVARPLTEQALAGEKLSRPWLGIRYQPLDAGLAARERPLRDRGRVDHVGTPAAQRSRPASRRDRRPPGERRHHGRRRHEGGHEPPARRAPRGARAGLHGHPHRPSWLDRPDRLGRADDTPGDDGVARVASHRAGAPGRQAAVIPGPRASWPTSAPGLDAAEASGDC